MVFANTIKSTISLKDAEVPGATKGITMSSIKTNMYTTLLGSILFAPGFSGLAPCFANLGPYKPSEEDAQAS